MATQWHKMRGKERCDECGSRRWYAGDDQLRYCENGHRLEGFATNDVGEDSYTMTGRVTKRKKEKREREALKLEGPAGKRLYLQSLQHVLRLQVDWVKKEGLKLDEEEALLYEGVVKELWVAVCSLPGVAVDDGQTGEESGTDAVPSTSEPETSDAETVASSGWLDKVGTRKLPNHTHTLALCYIACIILKQPVTTADFHDWVQKGDLEYLAALHHVPQNVKARLPAKYHRHLQVRDHIRPGKLLHTVQELAKALRINLDIKLPALNYTQILVYYILKLTLPLEVYLMVKCLIQILHLDFEYPDEKGKSVRAMDSPEVKLITLVLVVVKLLYPLDGVDRPPVDGNDPRTKQVNWIEWEDSRVKTKLNAVSNDKLEKGTEWRTTSDEVLLFGNKHMDDYMDWYEKMWADEDIELKTPAAVRHMFEEDRPLPPRQERSIEGSGDKSSIIQQRYRVLNDTMRYVEPQQEPEAINGARKRLARDFLPPWRTEEDLPHSARILYQEAADLATIPLKTLVTATSQMERKLEIWSGKREKERRGEEAENGAGHWKGNGKETEPS